MSLSLPHIRSVRGQGFAKWPKNPCTMTTRRGLHGHAPFLKRLFAAMGRSGTGTAHEIAEPFIANQLWRNA
jgi:hypothetical protein